jgi:hypothetical protein
MVSLKLNWTGTKYKNYQNYYPPNITVSLEATGSYRKLLEAFRSFINKICLLGGI